MIECWNDKIPTLVGTSLLASGQIFKVIQYLLLIIYIYENQ